MPDCDSPPEHDSSDITANSAGSPWTPVRFQLLEWFRQDAPSLAGAYEATVFLVSTPSVPARVHLVCHLVRDIYGKLPEILDGEFRFQSAGAVYPPFIDTIANHWRSPDGALLTNAAASETAPSASDRVNVPRAAARAVDDLLARRAVLKDQPRSTEVLARALFRRFAESGLQPPARLAATFEEERRWFTDRAHLVLERAKVPAEEGLLDHFASFEGALHSLVGEYFTGKEELDAILAQANA